MQQIHFENGIFALKICCTVCKLTFLPSQNECDLLFSNVYPNRI